MTSSMNGNHKSVSSTLSLSLSNNNRQLLEQLESDETFKHFLNPNLDVKSTSLLHGSTINAQINKISNGIEIVNQELHSLIANKYEDLIAQSTKIETLEDVLRVIQSRIQTLLSLLERLRAKLIEPYERISHQMVLLTRLQITCDLLRRLIRVIHLSKRLNQSRLNENEPTYLHREMTKAAQYINEIELLLSEDDSLDKIKVIHKDLLLVKRVKSDVIQQSDEMLSNGLQKQDQTQVGTAIQVFYSLKMLNQKIDEMIGEKQDLISKTIKEAVDVHTLSGQNRSSGPGRVVMPMTIGQNASLRSTLWNNIDSLLEHIYVSFMQINLLYKMMKKRRDTLSHVCFIDDINRVNGLEEFWSFVTKSLSEQMCKAANDSQLMKQTLEGEFPKLLSSFGELWKRIAREEKESGKDIGAEKVLRTSMTPFESAYLSRSLSLLFDSVNRVFADAKESAMSSSLTSSLGGTLSPSISAAPSCEDVEAIVKAISNELLVSSFDSQLSKSVAKNVSKTIHLFLVKCEQLAKCDGDATQVIGAFTSSQLLNATILNRLEAFKAQMNNLLASSACASQAMSIVADELKSIDALILSIINPLISSVTDSIEAIILTVHSEDYSSSINTNDAQCSLYMRELQGFIARISNDYFAELPECQVVKDCIHKVANRTIELFLRHTSLIRPISSYGKMKITADFAQLEMAIGPLCQRIGDLGKSYRALRSFKPLLFQDAETIAKSPVIGDLIPHSLGMQYLISSFGPTELKSPNEHMGWSLSRYTKWLDDHESESERLKLLKNTLEAYVKQVRQQQGKSFATVYPLLVELLQNGLRNCEQ